MRHVNFFFRASAFTQFKYLKTITTLSSIYYTINYVFILLYIIIIDIIMLAAIIVNNNNNNNINVYIIIQYTNFTKEDN